MPLRTLTKEKEDMGNKVLDFVKRTITALVLLPIVLFINYAGGVIFDLFLSIILALSIFEVINIVKKAKQMPIYKKLLWIISVSIYIICSLLSLKYIRSLGTKGDIFVIYLLIWIWAFDSAAYFAGTTIGGPKLLPKISPKKTWSGLIGGICAILLLPLLGAKLIKGSYIQYSILTWTLIGLLIGLVGQVGDLMESYFKRKFNVKDSGNLLPGHGGILDRLDSVFLGAIFFYIIIVFLHL